MDNNLTRTFLAASSTGMVTRIYVETGANGELMYAIILNGSEAYTLKSAPAVYDSVGFELNFNPAVHYSNMSTRSCAVYLRGAFPKIKYPIGYELKVFDREISIYRRNQSANGANGSGGWIRLRDVPWHFVGFTHLNITDTVETENLINSQQTESPDGLCDIFTDTYEVTQTTQVSTTESPHSYNLYYDNGIFTTHPQGNGIKTSNIVLLNSYTRVRTIPKPSVITEIISQREALVNNIAQTNQERDLQFYRELARRDEIAKQQQKDQRAVTVYGAMGASVGLMALALFA